MSSRKKRVANSQLCVSQITSWNFLTALTLLPSTRYLETQEPKAGKTERISRVLSTYKRPGAFPGIIPKSQDNLARRFAVSILQMRSLRLWKDELWLEPRSKILAGRHVGREAKVAARQPLFPSCTGPRDEWHWVALLCLLGTGPVPSGNLPSQSCGLT